jgi:hypothetical protein
MAKNLPAGKQTCLGRTGFRWPDGCGRRSGTGNVGTNAITVWSRFAPFLLPICASFSWPLTAIADGGAVRLLERVGNYQIAVFTAPTPLRAGPVDVSVLVQNADSHEPISGAQVTIKATQQDEPEVTVSHLATTDAATNKLFQAAILDLSAAGRWELEVSVDGSLGTAQARTEVEVAEPLPPYLALWPWVCWPIVPILLFAVYQRFARRRSH